MVGSAKQATPSRATLRWAGSGENFVMDNFTFEFIPAPVDHGRSPDPLGNWERES